MKQQISDWQTREVMADEAKLIIYQAVVEEKFPMKLHLGAPALLTLRYDAFLPRTMWSLSNAFTSAFKKLAPVRQFQLTAKLGSFLQNC